MKIPSPEKVADAIGVPVENWPSNCFAIASMMIKKGVVRGRAVYGFYHGPVAPTSRFDRKRPFQRHGWIVYLNRVIDPTRWVFEDVGPYIYSGPINEEYDEGMNSVKEALLRPPPGPDDPLPFQNAAKPRLIRVSPGADEALTALLYNGRRKDGKLTDAQLFWIANLPYRLLEPHNREIYDALAKTVDGRAWVPIDNWNRSHGL